MDDVADAPIDAAVTLVDSAATETAEVVDAATDAVTDTLQDTIRHLTDTLRVTGEGHSASLAGISDRLASIESHFLDAAQDAADDIAEIAEETIDTAAELPADATGEIEAVIETASEPPVRKKRGMIGAMSKKSRRG